MARRKIHRSAKAWPHHLLITTALTASAAAPAFAQAVPASADSAGAVEEIVVTASRTAQDGLQAPTPTQIVGAKTIEQQAATTVMEVLNQNPAFKATRSPGANATNTSSPAQATADLRALGGQRTLVLVNGSRVVPFAPASNLGVPTTTDLNLFPTLMIDRVDVVTGGASALYGSDAVSGVVNIIMKKKYDGLNVTAQTGISERGDYRTIRGGFIGGTSFNDDRGHVVLSADYSKNNGVPDIYSRGWGREEWMIVSNGQRATNGLPAFILAPNVHNSLGAGGVITSNIPGLTNMTFNPDGSIRPFQKGAIFGGSTMIGGEGGSIITGTALVPDVERFTAYGSLYYDFSDSLTGYIEGGYSRSEGFLDGVPMRLQTQAIRSDNAFIPDAVRALLPANVTSFNISRIGHDIGINHYRIVNKTPHGTIGLDGKLGGSWKWDAHASYGINYYSSYTTENPITQNLNFAIDAVRDPATGNIVCRAALQGNPAAAGCVPLNLFGEGNTTQAAREYIWGEGLAKVKYDQFTAALNMVGEPFSTWAGPVVVAFGGEYRRETQKLTADPIASANGFLTAGNAVPYSGRFNVKEGYVEATVPLLADLRFARKFDLNGAYRYADYSSVGGKSAWKLGAVWEPFEGFNLRVARSRDIRAPAINELASPGSNVTNNVTLIVDGKTKNAVIPQNTSAGDPNVDAEYADTWTAGFAYRGTGALRGFGVSADYYNIKIKNAITNLSTVNIATLCGQGDAYFCNLFTYGPDPNAPGERIHTGLVAGSLNVGAFEQEGIDMTLNYSTNVGFLGDGGRYSIAASGTYIFHAYVDAGTGAAPIDRAGENGWSNLGSIPTFRGNLSQTIGNKDFELTLQTIFISKGKQDVTYNTLPTNTINDNSVPSVTYFNLYGKIFAGAKKDFEFFWAINNLLDKDPPMTPYVILNGPVNGQYYDKVGRNFMIGVRKKF
ncbi:TonB-dependent receptor plug domain-containing protein [Sphingomonas histidinilytica]|uniref:TonB-dependent receptor plug domain-containing protein n=1 Tax=Rhizorhabdus histidinilytica TaxID=439228 RepID=UPI001ADA7885|nr:TonB-dependent receptor [Rhizorhabdus histidinilytica]MBO9379747.1 TonB-dependent receptor plug domain-containing protein [Rhizorhabdus histidinilytica]